MRINLHRISKLAAGIGGTRGGGGHDLVRRLANLVSTHVPRLAEVQFSETAGKETAWFPWEGDNVFHQPVMDRPALYITGNDLNFVAGQYQGWSSLHPKEFLDEQAPDWLVDYIADELLTSADKPVNDINPWVHPEASHIGFTSGNYSRSLPGFDEYAHLLPPIRVITIEVTYFRDVPGGNRDSEAAREINEARWGAHEVIHREMEKIAKERDYIVTSDLRYESRHHYAPPSRKYHILVRDDGRIYGEPLAHKEL